MQVIQIMSRSSTTLQLKSFPVRWRFQRSRKLSSSNEICRSRLRNLSKTEGFKRIQWVTTDPMGILSAEWSEAILTPTSLSSARVQPNLVSRQIRPPAPKDKMWCSSRFTPATLSVISAVRTLNQLLKSTKSIRMDQVPLIRQRGRKITVQNISLSIDSAYLRFKASQPLPPGWKTSGSPTSMSE